MTVIKLEYTWLAHSAESAKPRQGAPPELQHVSVFCLLSCSPISHTWISLSHSGVLAADVTSQRVPQLILTTLPPSWKQGTRPRISMMTCNSLETKLVVSVGILAVPAQPMMLLEVDLPVALDRIQSHLREGLIQKSMSLLMAGLCVPLISSNQLVHLMSWWCLH